MIIQTATPNDFPSIAKLINSTNNLATQQCLHSSAGTEPETLLGEIEKWHAEGEILFVIAQEDRQISALIGAEFDESLGRGWLWGPHVAVQPWLSAANQLFEVLRQALPDSIRQLDAYLNIKNQRALDFYSGLGFSQDQLAHVYSAQHPENPSPLLEACPPLAPAWNPGFTELHNAIFPNAYYAAERIIEQIDELHQVFIYPQADQALGYLYASVWPDGQTGEVEFLGVRQEARRRGIGKRLLLTALDWLFSKCKVASVHLTVNDEKATARALYESAGFSLLYSGVGMQKVYK